MLHARPGLCHRIQAGETKADKDAMRCDGVSRGIKCVEFSDTIGDYVPLCRLGLSNQHGYLLRFLFRLLCLLVHSNADIVDLLDQGLDEAALLVVVDFHVRVSMFGNAPW
jgi:hypothetical protein